MRGAVVLSVVVATAVLSAGCVDNASTDPGPPAGAENAMGLPPLEDWAGPNVTVSGRVFDGFNRTAGLGNATVTAQLVTQASGATACGAIPFTWQSWHFTVNATGHFGPFELPQPQGDDTTFRFVAEAPGYSRASDTRAGTPAALADVTFTLDPAARLTVAGSERTLVAFARDGDAGVRAMAAGVTTVPAGTFTVVQQDLGRAAVVTRIIVPPFGAANVTAPTAAPAANVTITGVAETAAGAAATAAVITARDADGRLAAVAFADAEGAFRLHPAHAGRFNVTGDHPSFGSAWVDVEATSTHEGAARLVFADCA